MAPSSYQAEQWNKGWEAGIGQPHTIRNTNMTSESTVAHYYYGRHRFRLTRFISRLRSCDYYVYDEQDLGDLDDNGEPLEPCYRGDLAGAIAMIRQRTGSDSGSQL